MIKDFFMIPWKEMKRRKLRSLLTLLGIVIGITAVVSLITLGQGLENAITRQFSALGNDKLWVTAKGNSLTAGLSIDAVKITEKDLETVEGVSGIKQAAGFIWSTTRIEFNDKVRYFQISGMPTDPEKRTLIGEAQNFKIKQGRSLEDGDKFKAVLGYEYTQPGLFDREIEIGDKVLIQNKEFKVIGFWDRIGSPPDDRSITIPLEAYAELFGTKDQLGLIIAQIQPGEDINLMEEKLEKELRKERGVAEGKEDFSIQSPQQLAEAFSTILNIVSVVLIGIAAISILVGGIGIMNTMYTSVLERTKEIGIMKALGAQNSHIVYLFLVESGLYGFGGGLIGVSIGIGLAKLVELFFLIFIGPAFLSISINGYFLLGTLLFSFIIGSVSGIAPALRASKLNPVESLRYE